MWTGRLPHLNGWPRLPGVPHFHVNRALGSTRSHRDLAKSRRVLGEISFISPKCLSSWRDLVAISSHWVLGKISFISQKSLSYRRDLVCLAEISFFISTRSRLSRLDLGEISLISPRSRRDLGEISSRSLWQYKSRRDLGEISPISPRSRLNFARELSRILPTPRVFI